MNKKSVIVILVLIIFLLVGIFYWQFSKSPQPTITLIYPNGGEELKENSTYTIKWETKNITEDYKVGINIRRIPPPALSEEGQEFDPVLFTDLENTGSKDWKVSYVYPDGNYMLEVLAYKSLPVTNPISDESDATFQLSNPPIAQASYTCQGGKTVEATFYKGEDYPVEPGEPPVPSGAVRVVLGDGRIFNLAQTLSADGGRYANHDESFIFWDKGETALVLEDDVQKDYKDCVLGE